MKIFTMTSFKSYSDLSSQPVKQSISQKEMRQILYALTHTWDLRNKTKGETKKRQTKQQTRNYRTKWWLPEARWAGTGETGDEDEEPARREEVMSTESCGEVRTHYTVT